MLNKYVRKDRDCRFYLLNKFNRKSKDFYVFYVTEKQHQEGNKKKVVYRLFRNSKNGWRVSVLVLLTA